MAQKVETQENRRMATPALPPESREAIGARLRATRIALELSQAEWCRETGIATNTWNNYETGRNRISLDEAFKVRKRFKIPLDWIFHGDDSMLPAYIAKNLVLPTDEEETNDEKKRA